MPSCRDSVANHNKVGDPAQNTNKWSDNLTNTIANNFLPTKDWNFNILRTLYHTALLLTLFCTTYFCKRNLTSAGFSEKSCQLSHSLAFFCSFRENSKLLLKSIMSKRVWSTFQALCHEKIFKI